VFYLVHHIVVKTNLFLVAGLVRWIFGTEELADVGGLYRTRPLLGLAFLVPALSLAGVPPLSGFWAKLLLIKAGLDASQWVPVAVALAVGLLTLYSMTKIWAEVFWKAAPEGTAARSGSPRGALVTIWGMAVVTIAMGLGVGPVFEMCARAGDQLANPSAYIAASLGRTPR
jgi:multicomponent Na+:H+ antiporter subunit D